MSDHRCIEFSMETELVQSPMVRCINWDKFVESIKIADFTPNLWSHRAIERESTELERIINHALRVSSYLRPVKQKHMSWWSSELLAMQNKVIALHRKWRESIMNLRRLVNYSNMRVKLLKRKNGENFATRLQILNKCHFL